MKTDFKVSSKMKVFAVISAILIVVGLALGTVLHFVSGNFFNYGGEYSSYKEIVVSYEYGDFGSEDDVKAICEDVFAQAGVSAYTSTSGQTTTGGEVVYRFVYGTDDAKLNNAIDSITTKISASSDDVMRTTATLHTVDAIVGSGYALTMGAIALASIVVLQLVYMIIRYKLSVAIVAFIADLHNVALFAALLALCRVPVTSTAIVYGVLVVLATALCLGFTFDRVRKNLKDEDYRKLSLAEISDLSAAQTCKVNLGLVAFMAIAAVVVFVLMAISSLSVIAVLSPVAGALVAFVCCGYGVLFFAPSVYPSIAKLFAAGKTSQKKAK